MTQCKQTHSLIQLSEVSAIDAKITPDGYVPEWRHDGEYLPRRGIILKIK